MTELDVIIRANIKLLCKHYKKKQKDLAEKLNFGPSYISDILRGKKPLPTYALPLVADFFGITSDMLSRPITEEELSIRDTKISKKQIFAIYGAMIHCYTTTQAMENPHFSKAVDYYLRITAEGNLISSMIRECETLFLKSFREDGILLGAANTISLILFQFGLLGHLSPSEYQSYNDLDIKKAEKLANITEAKRKNLVHDFIEKYKEIYNECILALHSSNEYRDLANFCVAKKYLIGMTENEFTTEMNRGIGIAMISEQTFLGNSYAKEFTEKATKLIQKI